MCYWWLRRLLNLWHSQRERSKWWQTRQRCCHSCIWCTWSCLHLSLCIRQRVGVCCCGWLERFSCGNASLTLCFVLRFEFSVLPFDAKALAIALERDLGDSQCLGGFVLAQMEILLKRLEIEIVHASALAWSFLVLRLHDRREGCTEG